jgi:hypothetical protein
MGHDPLAGQRPPTHLVTRTGRAPLLICCALALALAAVGCGTTTASGPIHRTGPIWTPIPNQTPPAAPAAGDWPTFDYDAARSGVNPSETAITRATVGGLHRLWSVPLPQPADSTPILLRNLTMPDGAPHDVLFITTLSGTTVALDAATGTIFWQDATSGPKITQSTPVADPARQYLYASGVDGKLHKYSVSTGAEVHDATWPVTLTTMTQTEKQGTAVNTANGYVYATIGGYIGDAPPYQGHAAAIRLNDGRVSVFNALCSSLQHVLQPNECRDNLAALWARAGVVVDPVTGYLFVTSGNGPYTANQSGGHDWGDSVVELTGDASRVVDSYTPPNFADLESSDQDLGSSMPALLPTITGSATPYLLVQPGKDGVLRLLDRQNLSGYGGPGHVGGELQSIAQPGGCDVLTQPAVWRNPATGDSWLYVANGCATSAYRAVTDSQRVTRLQQAWTVNQGGTSPILAGGVLFIASDHQVVARDPLSGAQLWSSTNLSAGGSIGAVHWQSPIVIGGRLYCADQDGNLTAYGL